MSLVFEILNDYVLPIGHWASAIVIAIATIVYVRRTGGILNQTALQVQQLRQQTEVLQQQWANAQRPRILVRLEHQEQNAHNIDLVIENIGHDHAYNFQCAVTPDVQTILQTSIMEVDYMELPNLPALDHKRFYLNFAPNLEEQGIKEFTVVFVYEDRHEHLYWDVICLKVGFNVPFVKN